MDVPDPEGEERTWSAGRGWVQQVGDEPTELEANVHGDDQERGVVWAAGGVAWTKGVEVDDGEAPIRCASEMYGGSGGGQKGVGAESGCARERGGVWTRLSRAFLGLIDVRP